MKLLSKQEVMIEKSQQLKMDIDEGVKLAQKIDLLRETASSEETRLNKFREESLHRMKMEIQFLLDEKNALLKEVTALREEKQALTERLKKTYQIEQEYQSLLEEI